MTSPKAVRVLVQRGERGATAVVVALSMIMLFAAGAVGFDIAKLLYERQALRTAVDSAAQSAALELSVSGSAGTTAATDAAYKFANYNYAGLTNYPTQSAPSGTSFAVKFYCVVANSTGTVPAGTADSSQMPYTCDPRTSSSATIGTYTGGVGGVKCTSRTCAIPCAAAALKCNSVTIIATKRVDFVFGPAINIPYGSTGAVAATSCLGPCGGEASPKPMNVVVMADRTYSMSSTAVTSMKSGIESMLTIMNPDQQYVAFGAIHKSITSGTCLTAVASSSDDSVVWTGSYVTVNRVKTWQVTTPRTFQGTWVPAGFSNSYLTSAGAADSSSTLVNSVECMTRQNNGIGTHLASALKGAARYILNNVDSNNQISSLDDGTRLALGVGIQNVIILETDGRPEEIFNQDGSTYESLSDSRDVGNTTGSTACQNLIDVANNAKKAGILIITIGYGDVSTMTCNTNGSGNKVRDVLNTVAGTTTTTSLVSGTDCSTTAGKTAENSDGDYYFCAASSTDLQSVFSAALGSISKSTKFVDTGDDG